MRSFGFDFGVEEEFFELLETFVKDLLHSSGAVYSLHFDFGVEEEFFLNYWKLSKKIYHIPLTEYIHSILILE